MNRETSNKIRFVVEEILPPLLRDTPAYRWLADKAVGGYVSRAAAFRERAVHLTDAEYADHYRNAPPLHDDGDNSEECMRLVASDVVGDSLCDVGCGTGALLRYVAGRMPVPPARMAGCDFIISAPSDPRFEYHETRIEALPFDDKAFDTVICTHVIEHILDHRVAIAELRRIARRRLIIVVPREREGRYTFNPHFHFFPYTHSFLRSMIPLPPVYECKNVGRDIYYREDIA